MVAVLGNRYKFQKLPKADEIRQGAPNGLEFRGGAFEIDDSQAVLVGLTVFADGLVAETGSHTNHTEDFLVDLLAFATREFRLRFDPSMVREKHYQSQLVISSSRVLQVVDPIVAAYCRYLSDVMNAPTPVQQIGLHFGPDPAGLAGKSIGLRLERKMGVAFDRNWYFSEAPLQTDQHLEALRVFEEMVG